MRPKLIPNLNHLPHVLSGIFALLGIPRLRSDVPQGGKIAIESRPPERCLCLTKHCSRIPKRLR
jgi:hypothetical protein